MTTGESKQVKELRLALPSSWRVSTLRSITTGKFGTICPSSFPDEEFEYYSIPAFQENGQPIDELGRKILSNKLVVKNGTVLFGKLNPRVLKVWLVNSRSTHRKIATTEFLPILPNAAATSEYIYFVCQSEIVVSEARRLVSGSTPSRERVEPSSFYKIQIPIPPIPEQQAIADVLWAVLEAKETRRRELALERERNAALMEHLFTHGTHSESRKRTNIGDLPHSWTVLPFLEVVEIGSGQVDPREEPYASMPHVGPDNIEADTGRLLPTKSARECNLISGKYLFTNEDVLYSKIRPYLRKAAIPDYPGICSADMYALRGRAPLVDREFLYHYLLSESFTNRAIAFQNRTGIPKINREQLGQIDVPIPGSEEQQQIGSVLTGCKRKADALQKEILVLGELFSSLIDELITGKVGVGGLIDGGSNE